MALEQKLRRVTSADVAREAGLSRATVSYVLNDTPHQRIPASTRRRVLDAAARLGYTPSAAARALRTGRSDVVLFLLPDWPIGTTIGQFLEHLSAALADAGLTLVAHPRTGSARPVVDVCGAVAPAAVLTWENLTDAETAAMRSAGIHVTVKLTGRSAGRAGELIVPMQRTGRLQVEHLASTGHRRLGYAFPDDPRLLSFAEPRLDGVRTA